MSQLGGPGIRAVKGFLGMKRPHKHEDLTLVLGSILLLGLLLLCQRFDLQVGRVAKLKCAVAVRMRGPRGQLVQHPKALKIFGNLMLACTGSKECQVETNRIGSVLPKLEGLEHERLSPKPEALVVVTSVRIRETIN